MMRGEEVSYSFDGSLCTDAVYRFPFRDPFQTEKYTTVKFNVSYEELMIVCSELYSLRTHAINATLDANGSAKGMKLKASKTPLEALPVYN